MDITSTVLLLVLGAIGLGWLAWISIRCLRKAFLLGSLLAGQSEIAEGHRVAMHGKVKVYQPVTAAGIQCLWVRQTQYVRDSIASQLFFGRQRRLGQTLDRAELATFSLLRESEEIAVEDPPSEVQGTQSVTESDSEFIGRIFSDTTVTKTEWLPLLEEMTAAGRIERRGQRMVLVKDPELGLVLSPHPPRRAAMMEHSKAWLGLTVVAAGIALLLFFGSHAR